MASTFLALKNIVYNALGKDSSDATASLIVSAAVNYAVSVVALIFKPPEMGTNSTAIGVSTSGSVSISTLDLLDIIRIYNTTDSLEMFFIPFEQWEVIVGTPTTVRFYTLHGETLYVKKTPTGTKQLNIFYIGWPSELSNDTDTVAFDHYDSYIISVASAISFAAFEEGESVDIWAKVSSSLGMAFLKGSQMREVIAGKTQLLESTISGALGGMGK